MSASDYASTGEVSNRLGSAPANRVFDAAEALDFNIVAYNLVRDRKTDTTGGPTSPLGRVWVMLIHPLFDFVQNHSDAVFWSPKERIAAHRVTVSNPAALTAELSAELFVCSLNVAAYELVSLRSAHPILHVLSSAIGHPTAVALYGRNADGLTSIEPHRVLRNVALPARSDRSTTAKLVTELSKAPVTDWWMGDYIMTSHHPIPVTATVEWIENNGAVLRFQHPLIGYVEREFPLDSLPEGVGKGDQLTVAIEIGSEDKALGYRIPPDQILSKRKGRDWEGMPTPTPPEDLDDENAMKDYNAAMSVHMAEMTKRRAPAFEQWRKSAAAGR
jgi:hypothetical protein